MNTDRQSASFQKTALTSPLFLVCVATFALALPVCAVPFTDPFDELRQIEGPDPGTERLERDRRLIEIIDDLYDPSNFLMRLSESDLRFYYVRDNTLVHSETPDATIDLCPGKKGESVGVGVQIRVRTSENAALGTRHEALVRLDGSEVKEARWINLDADDEMEFVCITRTGGTGAYYYGAVIDPSPECVCFCTFYSHGKPQINEE